jgi:DNA-binding CsgD family transcriptional regulator
MTHLLFLPEDQSFLLLDSDLPADELAACINAGQWTLPATLEQVLQANKSWPAGLSLKAVCFAKLVIATLIHRPGSASQRVQPERGAPESLSPRQKQILQCLIEGLTTQQIAARLALHPRTVQYHIGFIKTYFQAGTRAESIGRAVGMGLFRGHTARSPIYPRRKGKPKR